MGAHRFSPQEKGRDYQLYIYFHLVISIRWETNHKTQLTFPAPSNLKRTPSKNQKNPLNISKHLETLLAHFENIFTAFQIMKNSSPIMLHVGSLISGMQIKLCISSSPGSFYTKPGCVNEDTARSRSVKAPKPSVHICNILTL